MSDIGILDPSKQKKPVAQMPGAVQINAPKMQPGNTAAPAPSISVTNAPNVNGGKADFSSVTQPLQDFVTAKAAELSAGQDALKANTSIDDQATQQITGLTTSTINSLNNINKANRLPGGAEGKVAKLFSMFDSDYNLEAQRTSIVINKARADQISATAAGLKEQNNALPGLLAKISEAEKLIFDAQKDANHLAIEQQTLTNQQQNTYIAAQHLRLDMSKEQREATDFKIRGMTTAQIAAELPRAEAGKGVFAGKAGLLQERLTQEEAATTSLASAQLALSKGNREEFNARSVDFIGHLPVDLVAQRLADAQGKNQPLVSFPTGDGKSIDIPFNLVQQGMVQSLTIRDQTNKAVAAQLTDKLQIVPNITNISQGANAFASMDKRASQIYVNMANVLKNADLKNPDTVLQVGTIIKGYQTQLEEVGKDAASRMSTADAKGAMITASKNGGKFDSTGGAAVVADSVNIPSLSTNAKYGDAWDKLRVMTANQVNKQTGGGMSADVSSASDAQSLIAMLAAKPPGKQKINEVASSILTDPTKVKDIRDSMKGTMKASGMFNTITQLANQKDSNPFWRNMLSNIDQYKENGYISPAKMFDAMEQARIISHGKIDFTATYLGGLQNYARNADNGNSVDPSTTIQDKALEAAIFGDSPTSSVLGELHYTLRQAAEKARGDMGDRVKKDLTGETQKTAAKQSPIGNEAFDSIFGPAGIITAWGVDKFANKTGINIHDVPSATGTGLTVAQVQAIYGGGK